VLGPQCSYFDHRVAQAGDIYQKQIKINLERKKQKQTMLACLRNGTDPVLLPRGSSGLLQAKFSLCFINLKVNIFFSN
jgi:hypothetical protein